MAGSTDRIGLVTGASRGIGRAIASALAADGAHVILAARDRDKLEEVEREIRAQGGSANVHPLDMRDYSTIDALAAEVETRWGRLDALVGNAALKGPHATVAAIDPARLDEVMAVNAFANFRLIQAFDPLLRRSNAGRAVFMSSNCAIYHLPQVVAYQASKAAMESIVLTWATECADSKVRVNLYRPGGTRTDMAVQWFQGGDEHRTLKTPEMVAPHVVALLRADCDRNGEVVFYAGSEPKLVHA